MHVLTIVIGISEAVKSHTAYCICVRNFRHMLCWTGVQGESAGQGFGLAEAGEGRLCYRLPEKIDMRGQAQGAAPDACPHEVLVEEDGIAQCLVGGSFVKRNQGDRTGYYSEFFHKYVRFVRSKAFFGAVLGADPDFFPC